MEDSKAITIKYGQTELEPTRIHLSRGAFYGLLYDIGRRMIGSYLGHRRGDIAYYQNGCSVRKIRKF